MDSTRISIARILALGVPLTWQDAVAVAQEAAMLSDVNAAMNSRPSLVSPDTCFLTRAGDLELPETTDDESPEAVADLLRAMLGDSDVPEPLEALAYGSSTRDLSTDLAAFPIGNRRAVLARLAVRAISAPAAPAASATPAAPPAPSLPSAALAPAWTPPSERPPAPIPFPAPQAQMPPPFVATPRPLVVMQAPPFVAAHAAPLPVPSVSAQAVADTREPAGAPRRVGPLPPAPDAELRRLRTRTVEREARNQQLFTRLAHWLAWRPDSPDPRVLGGAAVMVAAVVSMVWRGGALPAVPERMTGAAASAVAADTPATVGSPPPASVPAATAPVPAPAGTTADTAARPRAPRAAGATSAMTVTTAAGAAADGSGERTIEETRRAPEPVTPITMPPPAPPAAAPIVIPAPTPSAGPSPTGDGRRAAIPRGPRGTRGRPTLYSENDADVAPPVMLRQQLPSALLEPDSAVPEDWPYLELLIDEHGAVERVRLRAKTPAPGQTLYRHRMLIAAAKAWQFEPAQLNGQPVRYVMRVPLEP
jgi:hypothetical protein